jgi:hypothetical protein
LRDRAGGFFAFSPYRAKEQSMSSQLKLVDKYSAAAILGISPETLKKYRLKPDSPFIKGIHYHVFNSRVIRYNPVLLTDWVLNQNNPVAHQRTIEIYLASLEVNQPKKRGRRAN